MEEQPLWKIDLFRTEDAEGVVGLYREIYGEYFPLKSVYRPEWHTEQARSGDTHRIVARLPDGIIAGSAALFRSVPTNPELYEGGGLMVSASYGEQGMVFALMQFLMESVPKMFPIRQIWGEAVCNHVVSQLLCIKNGAAACALEVEALPEETFKNLSERGQDIGGRVSTLVLFQSFRPDSQDVYLPGRYADVLKKLYEQLGLERNFLAPPKSRPEGHTRAHLSAMAKAGMSRNTVTQIGANFAEWLTKTEAELGSGIAVFQVILPLDTPGVGDAVEAARKAGYWLGGLMPTWYGTDGFLMQKMRHTPDFSKIRVYSKPGKEVLRMVQEDYEQREGQDV